jgi:hypothetical protein
MLHSACAQRWLTFNNYCPLCHADVRELSAKEGFPAAAEAEHSSITNGEAGMAFPRTERGSARADLVISRLAPGMQYPAADVMIPQESAHDAGAKLCERSSAGTAYAASSCSIIYNINQGNSSNSADNEHKEVTVLVASAAAARAFQLPDPGSGHATNMVFGHQPTAAHGHDRDRDRDRGHGHGPHYPNVSVDGATDTRSDHARYDQHEHSYGFAVLPGVVAGSEGAQKIQVRKQHTESCLFVPAFAGRNQRFDL